MPHHHPPVFLSHKLAGSLFGHLLPKKKGKPVGIAQAYQEHEGKAAYKTIRGKLTDGTPVAIRFNLVDGTAFIGMDDEVE